MTLNLVNYDDDEDLPDTDGQPMDSDLHRTQATVYLIEPLREYFRQIGFPAYVSGNSFVYYDQRRGAQPVGPDFYVVNGGRQGKQKMWVAWREGNLLPSLVVEMLSPTSEENDRGKKFCLYRDRLKTRTTSSSGSRRTVLPPWRASV